LNVSVPVGDRAVAFWSRSPEELRGDAGKNTPTIG